MHQPDSAREAVKQAMAEAAGQPQAAVQPVAQAAATASVKTLKPVIIDSKKVISACPECSSSQIEYAGGCYTCRDCGFSKCV